MPYNKLILAMSVAMVAGIVFTLWLWFFFATLQLAEVIFYIPSPCTKFLSMFTVWHVLFSLVLAFLGLRIEALILSTVLGKCIYKMRRTGELNFCPYVPNLV